MLRIGKTSFVDRPKPDMVERFEWVALFAAGGLTTCYSPIAQLETMFPHPWIWWPSVTSGTSSTTASHMSQFGARFNDVQTDFLSFGVFISANQCAYLLRSTSTLCVYMTDCMKQVAQKKDYCRPVLMRQIFSLFFLAFFLWQRSSTFSTSGQLFEWINR